MRKNCLISVLTLIAVLIELSFALNKYSKEANVKQLSKPFRMKKLNDFWEKAVLSLDESKLKNLMADLKVQDKEEVTLKKFKADGQDKDGIKEAQVRKQLAAILKKYGLSDDYKSNKHLDNNAGDVSDDSHSDQYIEKQIFRDKKLDKLWKKAQNSGLNDEQLLVLKDELRHHELKIEQYNQLIADINVSENGKKSKDDDFENSINAVMYEEEIKTVDNKDSHQALKEKHFDIKQDYKRLSDKVINSANDFKTSKQEFEETKAQTLWDLALKSDFNREELLSLREELDHFQNRIKKLRHFETQLEMETMGDKHLNQNIDSTVDDSDKHVKRKVKDLKHKV
ncbi:unnamed protein product, partial [Medioppia subpectinata]